MKCQKHNPSDHKGKLLHRLVPCLWKRTLSHTCQGLHSDLKSNILYENSFWQKMLPFGAAFCLFLYEIHT